MSVSMFNLLWVKLSFWFIENNDYQDCHPDVWAIIILRYKNIVKDWDNYMYMFSL